MSTLIALDTAPPLTHRKNPLLEGVNVLTGQKRKFAQALMSGSSQAEAARKAGYSEKTARSQGSRLAKDPDIIAFIEKNGADEKPTKFVGLPVPPSLKTGKEIVPEIEPVPTLNKYEDPLEFLKSVMNDPSLEIDDRKDAAKAMLPYLHQKKGEGGKKDAKGAAAKNAANKFAVPAPPKLVVNNRG
nr:terminase small subunit [Scandinavium hiltneri]